MRRTGHDVAEYLARNFEVVDTVEDWLKPGMVQHPWQDPSHDSRRDVVFRRRVEGARRAGRLDPAEMVRLIAWRNGCALYSGFLENDRFCDLPLSLVAPTA